MFELKYSVTDADMRAVNKKINLFYFTLYFCVAVCGLAVGITATVLKPTSLTYVAGIILTVLGGLLLACALLLLVAPKNALESAVPTGEAELDVKIDHDGVTVGDTPLSYSDMTAVKNKKSYVLVYFGKTRVLLVKDAIASGGTLAELYAFISARAGRTLPPSFARDNVENSGKQPHDDGADASDE